MDINEDQKNLLRRIYVMCCMGHGSIDNLAQMLAATYLGQDTAPRKPFNPISFYTASVAAALVPPETEGDEVEDPTPAQIQEGAFLLASNLDSLVEQGLIVTDEDGDYLRLTCKAAGLLKLTIPQF